MTAIVNLCRVVRTGLHSPLSSVCRRSAIHTQCPYMDSSSLQASFALAPVPTAHVYSASYYGIVLMQGHDGLFARRLPIASTCFTHLDIRGFCRRRFDRFAIARVASQSWCGGDSPGVNKSGRCPIRLVISAVAQHRPGHACSFVGQRDSGHVGM